MPVMHDFRCRSCGATYEHFIDRSTQFVDCPDCEGEAEKVFLVSAKPDWLGLAQGTSPSPEAVNRFKRSHRHQKAKETKSYNEHGDYGPQPGGRGLTYEGPIMPRDGDTLLSE